MNTNDLDLLKRAAKAAGYEFRGLCAAGDPMLQHPPTDIGPRFYVPTKWNPLADDGDALRLAVKLRLSVKHGTEIGDSTPSAYAYFGDAGECCFEPHGTDPLDATRRAIVRAAAEIGRNHEHE